MVRHKESTQVFRVHRLQTLVTRMWRLVEAAKKLTGDVRDADMSNMDKVGWAIHDLEGHLAELTDDVQAALMEKELEERARNPKRRRKPKDGEADD